MLKQSENSMSQKKITKSKIKQPFSPNAEALIINNKHLKLLNPQKTKKNENQIAESSRK